MGFRRFRLRGRDKVTAERHLVCDVHDLAKLFRGGRPSRVIPGCGHLGVMIRSGKALGLG